MRILFAVSEFHRRGGFPRHGADLASALARRGHDVTVLTRRAEPEERDRILSFRTYRCPDRTLFTMAAEARVVTRELRRARGDFDAAVTVGIPVLAPAIVIEPSTHRGYFRQTIATLPRMSVRRWVERARPFHRIMMAWEGAMLRGRYPSYVVVGNERYARECVELYGFPAGRIVVIPHGIALEEFSFSSELRAETRQAWGVGPDEPVLLTVAGRARQKGLDVVAEALPLMPADRPWRFVCAGDGSRSQALESRTAELRRAGRVMLLGRVPDVCALYSAADLLVFPSRYDGWGMVVTEALACGLPVACSSRIGAASAVRPGVNGALLGDPDDPVELRDAILALLGRAFDRGAVAASVADLSWDACAERMEPYLEASARLPALR